MELRHFWFHAQASHIYLPGFEQGILQGFKQKCPHSSGHIPRFCKEKNYIPAKWLVHYFHQHPSFLCNFNENTSICSNISFQNLWQCSEVNRNIISGRMLLAWRLDFVSYLHKIFILQFTLVSGYMYCVSLFKEKYFLCHVKLYACMSFFF